MSMTANWKNIGPLSNIPVRGSRRLCLRHEGRPVAVFRTGEDEVFALVDECPHKKGPLSEGIISGRTVACPLHNWVIDLRTGRAAEPDEGCVAAYAVQIENGRVLIEVSARLVRGLGDGP